MKIVYLFAFTYMLLFPACQYSEGTPNIISSSSDYTSHDQIAIIYDLNAQQNGLDVKAVTIQNPSGDTLRDLLIAFIKECSIPSSYDQLELVEIQTKGALPYITFSTRSAVSTNWSESLFFKALNMTLSRNVGDQAFQIMINDQALVYNDSRN